MQNKIKIIEELANLSYELKNQGKIIVHCHGVFDLIHPGHIKHFQDAKSKGDVLIVTITPDRYVNKGPGRPIFSEKIRLDTIAALECVDYIAINKWPTAIETIEILKPNFYVKGIEFKQRKDVTGAIAEEESVVRSVGGELYITPAYSDEISSFSSTKLLNENFNLFPEKTQTFLSEFKQKYSAESIIKKFEEIKDLKVLIIGDTIIDEYYYCRGGSRSPKEMLVTMNYLYKQVMAGGVLACANHVANFCDKVDLITCLGTKDSKTEFVLKNLNKNINPKLFYRNDTGTLIYRRYVEDPFITKLFEIYYNDYFKIPKELNDELVSYLDKVVDQYDLVLVADFGHGLLAEECINIISRKAKFLALDTQSNAANWGYNLITKYPRANYACIDEPEIRLATQNQHNSIEDLAKRISDQLQCNKIIVTRGHLGAMGLDREKGALYPTPIFSTKVTDRIGAGTAFLSITSPLLAKDWPIDLVIFIGNVAGAIAVSYVCNKESIKPVPLFRFITTLLK